MTTLTEEQIDDIAYWNDLQPEDRENLPGDRAMAIINSLRAATEWISVAERLPEIGRAVLVAGNFYSVWALTSWRVNANDHTRGEFGESDVWYSRGERWPLDRVTHWMPIPPLPETP